jgi:hypothetical protein
MRRIQERIKEKQACISRHPLFAGLDGDFEEVIGFAPALTFWVMTFQDCRADPPCTGAHCHAQTPGRPCPARRLPPSRAQPQDRHRAGPRLSRPSRSNPTATQAAGRGSRGSRPCYCTPSKGSAVTQTAHAAQNSNHILDATHEQISIYNGADRAETQSAGLPGACDSGREHHRCDHHVLAPGRASPRIAIRCAGAKFRDRESNRGIGSRQRREIARPHTGSASQ